MDKMKHMADSIRKTAVVFGGGYTSQDYADAIEALVAERDYARSAHVWHSQARRELEADKSVSSAEIKAAGVRYDADHAINGDLFEWGFRAACSRFGITITED